MANEKISQMPAGAPAQTTDQVAIARSGSNFSLTVADIIARFAAAFSFSAITSGSNLAQTLTVGNGSTLAPTGTGIIIANQVQGTATPIQASSITLLGSPVAISGLTTVLTKTVTMPASGGPFRAFASYAVNCDGTNSGEVSMTVNDGTNNFATSSTSTTGGATDFAVDAASYSPVTYANGATVTFTLKAATTMAGSTNAHVNNANSLGQASWLNVAILPSV